MYKKFKLAPDHSEVGMSLVPRLEPLIDACLDAGISSPEFESLLRSAFVLRAFEKLLPHPTSGRPPTVNKVSLATGIDWEQVASIRKSGYATVQERMKRRELASSKTGRVLHGWITDNRFLDGQGHPLELPIKRNRERKSFVDLALKYAPSTHPGTLLAELSRQKRVKVVDETIVRFSATF